jgi:MarR family transcriptional regulator, organic hydroperoxide resistance regulator
LPARRSRPDAGADSARLAAAVDGVRRLIRGLRLAEHRTRSATGLSAAQLFVLDALRDTPTASLRELATRTFTDRTSVRAVAARLASDGAVRIERDASDRRRQLVRITSAGRRLLAAAPAPPTVQLLTALRRLTPRQLRLFSSSLGALLDAMGLGDEPAAMLFERDAAPRSRRRAVRTSRAP